MPTVIAIMSETRIDLDVLKHLQALFSYFSNGKYLNRFHDHELWVALEKHQESYHQLFKHLGYDLRIDQRGFAWFWCEEATSNTSAKTRKMALLLLCLLEFQADQGLQLARFMDWDISLGLLQAIAEKHAALLEAEQLDDSEQLVGIMHQLVKHGFAADQQDGGGWKLLSATYRYLDEFEVLSQQVGRSQELEIQEDVV